MMQVTQKKIGDARFTTEMEADFRETYFRNSLVFMRWNGLLGFLLMAALGGLHAVSDATPYWRHADIVIYLGIICPFFALLLIFSFTRSFPRFSQFAAAVSVLIPALSFIISGGMSRSGICMWVIAAYTLVRLRFINALAVGLILSVAYTVYDLSPGASQTPAYDIVSVIVANFIGILSGYSMEKYLRREFQLSRLLTEEQKLLQEEHVRSERLLHNILPVSIAEKLKRDTGTIAEGFADVSVLFADIVGFTTYCASLPPGETVDVLNEIFSCFDALAYRHGLEKIKTIGDAYMVAAGLPIPRPDHVRAAADMALDMQAEIHRYNRDHGSTFRLRIGIHTGPVVAGVIGAQKFSYDLWGDTVNTASRMESQGMEDSIQVTSVTFERLQHLYLLEERGILPIKGKGAMTTYLLKGRRTGEEKDEAESKDDTLVVLGR
jgi:adenylate cyclase